MLGVCFALAIFDSSDSTILLTSFLQVKMVILPLLMLSLILFVFVVKLSMVGVIKWALMLAISGGMPLGLSLSVKLSFRLSVRLFVKLYVRLAVLMSSIFSLYMFIC